MTSDLVFHARKNPWSAILLIGFAAWIVYLSLTQGLTWDEPWLMGRSWDLLSGKPLDPFKPFSGLVLAPVVKLEGSWLFGRTLFITVQVCIGVVLFRLMPEKWSCGRRILGLVLLWMEPTFRERVLEMRTDGLVLLLMLLATLAWLRMMERPILRGIIISLCWALGILLSFKTILFWFVWLIGILWVNRGWHTPRTWLNIGGHAFLTTIMVVITVGLAGWVLHVVDFGAKIVQGTPSMSLALSENQGWISSTWKFYFQQVTMLGLPFWGLAFLGLFLRMARVRQEQGVWGIWEVVGWMALTSSAFYFGAFPYHFVCIIPGVLPSVMGGLKWLEEAFPSAQVPIMRGLIVGSALFSLLGALPVLRAPTIGAQVELMNYASAWVGPGRSYVDGVGMLSPAPHAAPFATGAFMQSGAADGMWRRWEAEHASVFVRNGRTEMLLNKGNAEWLGNHVTLIHPQVGVVGVSSKSIGGTLEMTWAVPWDDKYILKGIPGWQWRIGGEPIQDGQPFSLSKGKITLQGKGPGPGTILLVLAPSRGRIPTTPPMAQPFYIPFQRRLLDL